VNFGAYLLVSRITTIHYSQETKLVYARRDIDVPGTHAINTWPKVWATPITIARSSASL
jgi:hypothetical protein